MYMYVYICKYTYIYGCLALWKYSDTFQKVKYRKNDEEHSAGFCTVHV